MDEPLIDPHELAEVIARTRNVAADYYRLTGRPLGITGEIAEYEVAQLLGMTLAPVRAAGYNAFKSDGTKSANQNLARGSIRNISKVRSHIFLYTLSSYGWWALCPDAHLCLWVKNGVTDGIIPPFCN